MQKKIEVYTTSYCPYCDRAKNLLQSKGFQFEEIDVSDSAQRDMLIKKANGRKTVPQIFIGDYHVGGFDDLYALEQSNKLENLVNG